MSVSFLAIPKSFSFFIMTPSSSGAVKFGRKGNNHVWKILPCLFLYSVDSWNLDSALMWTKWAATLFHSRPILTFRSSSPLWELPAQSPLKNIRFLNFIFKLSRLYLVRRRNLVGWLIYWYLAWFCVLRTQRLFRINLNISESRRSQWPCGLRHELSSLPKTLARIPIKAWMSVCAFILFVLSCV
jgi:hypothetical protein